MYGVEVASVPLAIETSYEGHLYGVAGSSGGYAETVFRHAAKTLFGKVIEGHLEFKTIRNSDFREVALEVEGKTLLKFALCYGFQNLQNIVRRVKMRKCDYHFVEIMACPSGCMNGGADPFKNSLVKSLYDEWLEQPGSEKAKKHVHTEYYPVVKSITAQLHNW
ncbi:protein NAR1 [Citrus sinensis]|uniref:Protein NAR1 n=2 Tax=Citrus sinensis TaxID=2711 RepID=A0ACB8KPC6_CITSI|nr:protein NAR1 [Citrus sinensis]KAH9756169.1 protein NAR1 [Citrus sinensis]